MAPIDKSNISIPLIKRQYMRKEFGLSYTAKLKRFEFRENGLMYIDKVKKFER